MNRPLWQRIIDPDDPRVWAGRLSAAAVVISLVAFAISLIVVVLSR